MSYKRAPGRSLEEWMDLVTECRQSGLTDAAWCNEHGISPSCFYNAVTRLRKNCLLYTSYLTCKAWSMSFSSVFA